MENKYNYPTAKEKLDSGVWSHRRKFTKGMLAIHYYLQQNDDKIQIYYMDSSSTLGALVFLALKLLCKAGRWIFNLVSKEAGSSVFNNIINEISELLLARKHKLHTGHSIQLANNLKTLDECDIAIQKHIDKL